MVDSVDPISASSATSATRVDRSLSITSEPDNKWVAERQAQIDRDLEMLQDARAEMESPALGDEGPVDDELPPLFEGHARKPKSPPQLPAQAEGEDGEEHLLSGESDRIGSWNFDEDTPFGDRVAII